MSALALEIDAALNSLDPATAAKLERLVRDALALVKPGAEAVLASNNPAKLDAAYFNSVIGAFSDVEFDRPPQGALPPIKGW